MSRMPHITTRAQKDVRHIFRWLQRRSPRGAAAWHQAFWKAVQRIISAPESHGPAPEGERLKRQLFNAVFKTRAGRRYRIVFEFSDAEIIILRVRGPWQRPLGRRDLPTE